MGRPRVVDRQEGFGGGLNTSADPSQLQPNQFRAGENGRLTVYGAFAARNGTRRLTGTALAGAIQNGFTWYRLTATVLLVVVNGTLYAATQVPFTNPESLLSEASDFLVTEDADFLVTESSYTTFTAVTGALSATQTPDFAAFRSGSTECVFIADGGPLNSYDGSTLTTNIASTPGCVSLAVYNKRMYGVTGTDQGVYYSALEDGATLGIGASGGGQALIRTFSNQRTTAVANNGNALLIFHENGISRWTGYTVDDISIDETATGVSGQVGTVAPLSVVETVKGVFFLGNDGFYVVGDGRPERISVPIDATVRQLTGNQIRQTRGCHVGQYKEVRWFVPDVGVLAFNYEQGVWSAIDTGGYLSPVTTALWESQDESGRPILMRGDSAGHVSQCDLTDTYLDNIALDGTGGDVYEVFVQCHRLFSGDTAGEKSLRKGYIVGDTGGSQAITIEWTTAQGTETYTLDPTTQSQNLLEFPLSGRGNSVDVTIRDAGSVGAVYSSLEVEGFSMGRRGP